ncbi:MAG: hypothetical protein QF447_07830 [Candidatus Thioglobus sp.]|nr:hypothetical protein [Candidatus Thioglobus sp.]
MYWDNVPITSYEEDVVIVKRFIGKLMTDSQIAEAQKLAREWMRKHQ